MYPHRHFLALSIEKAKKQQQSRSDGHTLGSSSGQTRHREGPAGGKATRRTVLTTKDRAGREARRGPPGSPSHAAQRLALVCLWSLKLVMFKGKRLPVSKSVLLLMLSSLFQVETSGPSVVSYILSQVLPSPLTYPVSPPSFLP